MFTDETILDILGTATVALALGIGTAAVLGVEVPDALLEASPDLLIAGLAGIVGAGALRELIKQR